MSKLFLFCVIKKESFGELSGAVISNQTEIVYHDPHKTSTLHITLTQIHVYVHTHTQYPQTVHALHVKWNPVHTCACTPMHNTAAATPLLRRLLIVIKYAKCLLPPLVTKVQQLKQVTSRISTAGILAANYDFFNNF